MKIVVFYSFKGGVGRTTCLLSTAYMLALRGRRVVVADWDLHAPGLSLMECMWPADGGLPEKGILEYLNCLRPPNREEPRVAVESLWGRPRLIAEAQARTNDDGRRSMQGDLFFIPAGNLGGGVEAFIEAVKKSELHNLKHFLADIDDDPRMVFKLFCDEVRRATIPWNDEAPAGEPHYLLVDCRTGITEIGDLLLGDATDFNVIVYGQDLQNLEGLRVVLNASPRQAGDLVANTMLIWSGDVAGQEELKRDQRRRKRALVAEVTRRDSLGLAEPFPREFLLPFNPELVYSNVPLVHRVPDSEFAGRFAEMTDYLEERCLWEDKLVEAAISPLDPSKPESPEQRRMRIATTPVQRKSELLRDALMYVELGRGVTSLLFNPPPWNLAAFPTPELAAGWTEDAASDDCTLLVQLLAYSLAFPASEKRAILQRRGTLSGFQFRELLKFLVGQRYQLISSTGESYWHVLLLTLKSAMEWLALLVELGPAELSEAGVPGAADRTAVCVTAEASSRAHDVLCAIVEGRVVECLPASSQPLSPLLVGEAIRATSSEPNTLLPGWLRSQSLDPLDLRVGLTAKACANADQLGFAGDVRAFCWERNADALDDRGQAAPETERARWFDRAVDAYQQSLALRPDHARTLHGLGRALGRRGQAAPEGERAGWFDRAIETFQRSLTLRPDHPDTLGNLGAALAHRGQAAPEGERAGWFDRAIETFQRSLTLRPDHPDTLTNLGAALDGRGRAAPEGERAGWFDRAIEAFQRSLTLRPDHPDTLYNLGNALDNRGRAAPEGERTGWFDRAIDAYQQSLTLRPDHPGTLTNLGAALDGRGRAAPEGERVGWFDRAIETYQRSLALRPDHPDTLTNLGIALADRGGAAPEGERVGWFDRAIETFQRSLAIRPGDTGTTDALVGTLLSKWRVVADGEEKASLLTTAAALIQKAMEKDADRARYNYACVLALQGETARALAEVKTLLAREPQMRCQVAKDEDFASLAELPEFQQLVADR